jgi:hypothetical protein
VDIGMLKSIARIFNSPDGSALMEYLEEVAKTNFKHLKHIHPEMHGIYVGRAQAIDEVKDFIINAESKCIEKTKTEPSDWSL